MKNNNGDFHEANQKKSISKVITRQEISENISDILCSKFEHPHCPIKETTLKRISISELIEVYSFLTEEIIKNEGAISRPESPVKSLNHQCLATGDYKKAMIDYISNFGYKSWSECIGVYPPSFLEAFANYCEYRDKNEESKLV